jgi:hypothetical protein
MTKMQRQFIENGLLSDTISGAFQHATMYNDQANVDARQRLGVALRKKLKELSVLSFRGAISGAQHVDNICQLADQLTQDHGPDLDGGRFRIGVAQKALNLYLKYLWCLDWIYEPPHCPFDNGIIRLLRPTPRETLWTQMDSRKGYEEWVCLAKHRAQSKSLAEWELSAWTP